MPVSMNSGNNTLTTGKSKLLTSLMFVFIVSFGGGALLFNVQLGTINLHAFRIVLLVSSFIFLVQGYFRKLRSGPEKYFILMCVLWVLFAAVSFRWSLVTKYAWKDVYYVVSGGLMFFCLTVFSELPDFKKKFVSFWVLGYFINLVIAGWEIFTGSHFNSEYSQHLFNLRPEHFIHFAPASVFGNPNLFSVYLVLSMTLFVILRKHLSGFLFAFLMVSSLFLILYTHSKISLLSTIPIAVYYFYSEAKFDFKSISRKSVGNNSLLLVIVISGLFLFNDVVTPANQKGTPVSDKAPVLPKSELIRKNLVFNGITFFLDSRGRGIGAGQFQAYMEKGLNKYPTAGISNPHSGIIEILSEYGIIGIALVVFFYLGLMIYTIRHFGLRNSWVTMLCILELILLSNANSGFLSSSVSWMVMIVPVIFLPEARTDN